MSGLLQTFVGTLLDISECSGVFVDFSVFVSIRILRECSEFGATFADLAEKIGCPSTAVPAQAMVRRLDFRQVDTMGVPANSKYTGEFKPWVMKQVSLRRPAQVEEIANGAMYLLSDKSS